MTNSKRFPGLWILRSSDLAYSDAEQCVRRATEYLVNDRLSFMRFLGLRLSDHSPDARTVWLFRERLTQAGAIGGQFNCFDAILRNAGYLPMSGQILNATLVAVPKQRNTNAEKADLRAGRIPENWQDRTAKLSHKDCQARWTLKFTKAKRHDDGAMSSSNLAIPFFGYKSQKSIAVPGLMPWR